jgi:hypothetical protein
MMQPGAQTTSSTGHAPLQLDQGLRAILICGDCGSGKSAAQTPVRLSRWHKLGMVQAEEVKP